MTTFLLLHLTALCFAPGQCIMGQTVLDAYDSPKTCLVVQKELSRRIEDELFVCAAMRTSK